VTTRFLGAAAICAPGRSLGPLALTVALLALASMGARPALSAAEGAGPDIIPTFRTFPLSASRALAMGGACSAIIGGENDIRANPAALAFRRPQPVIIEITRVASQESRPRPAQRSGVDRPHPHARLLEHDAQAADQPTTAEPPSRTGLLTSPGVSCSVAGPPGGAGRWAWGVSADASATLSARYLTVGLLSRLAPGWSLGARWDQAVLAGGRAVSSPTVGAAYEGGRWTLAADAIRGRGWLSEGPSALLGAEYRLPNGLALRLGSAGGSPTCGLGYRTGRWRADIARGCPSDALPMLPGLLLRTSGNITTVSVSYQCP